VDGFRQGIVPARADGSVKKRLCQVLHGSPILDAFPGSPLVVGNGCDSVAHPHVKCVFEAVDELAVVPRRLRRGEAVSESRVVIDPMLSDPIKRRGELRRRFAAAVRGERWI
jgi:hypothetical protein